MRNLEKCLLLWRWSNSQCFLVFWNEWTINYIQQMDSIIIEIMWAIPLLISRRWGKGSSKFPRAIFIDELSTKYDRCIKLAQKSILCDVNVFQQRRLWSFLRKFSVFCSFGLLKLKWNLQSWCQISLSQNT